jgi:hypothetical protein
VEMIDEEGEFVCKHACVFVRRCWEGGRGTGWACRAVLCYSRHSFFWVGRWVLCGCAEVLAMHVALQASVRMR